MALAPWTLTIRRDKSVTVVLVARLRRLSSSAEDAIEPLEAMLKGRD
jgi:hypothetical protein